MKVINFAQLYIFVGSFTLLVFAPVEPVLAEQPVIQPRLDVEPTLRGLTEDQLTELLGKPDKVLKEGERNEWTYGNSLIFFSNGVVNGWSDEGEFESRKFTASFNPPDKMRKNKLKETEVGGWENSWQREDPVTSDDVILQLKENK